MERESQGEEGKAEGGRCWRPARISALTPRGEGCLLPTPALCLRVFFLAATHSCTSSGRAGSAGELTCLEAALGVSRTSSGAPAGLCPSCSRGSITCKKTLPVLASCPSLALSHSPTGISWDCFPNKLLALESSSPSLRLGEPELRSRCQENQTSRKLRDLLSM